MISAEIEANNAKVRELADEKGMKVAQNVTAGVVGVFVWPVVHCEAIEALRRRGQAARE
jgi:hypothetical protein